MQTGVYYTIGTTHQVCEDYALASRTKKGQNYVVFSDGCSNGNGPKIDSDWGARILARAAEEQLLRVDNVQVNAGDEVAALLADDYTAFFRSIIAVGNVQRRLFPMLDSDCLTATLGMIYPMKEDLRVLLAGDGVYGGKMRDGTIVIEHVEFLPGGESGLPAPFYIRYLIDPALFQRYIKLYGGTAKVTSYRGAWDSMQCTESLHDMKFDNFTFASSFPVKDFEFVFAGSDGLSSFYHPVEAKQNKEVSVLEVLRVLLSFPAFSPGFVERQCNWAFKQDQEGTFVRRQWHNGDDVSLGVVYCGDIA